jgi:hypothetical protein
MLKLVEGENKWMTLIQNDATVTKQFFSDGVQE